MADYRKKLTLIDSSASRVMVLQCNKSERKSFVKHYQDDGTTAWAKETVVGWHPDKTLKSFILLCNLSRSTRFSVSQTSLVFMHSIQTRKERSGIAQSVRKSVPSSRRPRGKARPSVTHSWS